MNVAEWTETRQRLSELLESGYHATAVSTERYEDGSGTVRISLAKESYPDVRVYFGVAKMISASNAHSH